MKFESKTIRTRDYRKTIYGKISIVLFILSSIVIFINSSGFFEKDLLVNYLGPYHKSIALMSLLIYLNGFFVLLSNSFYRSFGRLSIDESEIIASNHNEEIRLDITNIESIEIEYLGHKKNWNAWFPGKINTLEIRDKQANTYSYHFILNSNDHKLRMIDNLLKAHEQGINIKIDYKVDYGSYVGDKDFKAIRLMK